MIERIGPVEDSCITVGFKVKRPNGDGTIAGTDGQRRPSGAVKMQFGGWRI
jgi:hypothetical protein